MALAIRPPPLLACTWSLVPSGRTSALQLTQRRRRFASVHCPKNPRRLNSTILAWSSPTTSNRYGCTPMSCSITANTSRGGAAATKRHEYLALASIWGAIVAASGRRRARLRVLIGTQTPIRTRTFSSYPQAAAGHRRGPDPGELLGFGKPWGFGG